MKLQAVARMSLTLLEALLMLSSVPLMVTGVQCPTDSVLVGRNGTLVFRALPPGSDNPDPVYDPGAIGGWYALAAGFVDVVRPGTLPYDQIEASLETFGVPCSIPGTTRQCPTQSTDFDPFDLLRSFAGWWAAIIAVTVIGGLLGFSFLIWACVFWCCRCCGNCGGGKTQKVTDNMDCKTFTFTVILLLFTLLLSVGVVLAFFSNEQTFDSLDNFQSSINEVAATGVDYINDTIIELEELLCQLAAPMNSITSTVVNEAKRFNATLGSQINQLESEVLGILGNLNNLTGGINATSDVLSSVSISTTALTTSFTTLQSTLTMIRNNITTLMSDCTTAVVTNPAVEPVCRMIPEASTFQTVANFNNLPNVTDELQSVRDALNNVNLDELISQGQEQFDSIAQSITPTVDDNLGNVVMELENVTSTALTAVGNVTQTIRVYLNDTQDKNLCPPITEAFNNLNTNLNDLVPSSPVLGFGDLRSRRQTGATTQNVLNVGYIQQCIVNQGFDFVREYDVYRYAVGIVICSISLFTILFVLLGVTFGMIGFRKNIDPPDRTRLSHCGGICLLVGVAVTFLFGFLLLTFSAVVFFFGANAQKLCQALDGPEYPLFSELVDDQMFWGRSLGGQLFLQVNPGAEDPVLSVSVALRNCRDDQALYTAFNLSNLLPSGSISSQIQALVNLSQVEDLVDGLIEGAADSFNFSDNSFLPTEARTAIDDFVGSNVADINITEFTDELNRALLGFNISNIIDQLNNISATLGSLGAGNLQTRVNGISQSLEEIRDNQIPLIKNQTATLSADVMQLDSVINTTVMNVTRLLDTTNKLISNITGQVLNGFLNDSVRGTIDRTIGYVNQYIAHLDTAVARDVSRCQPLWAIYTTMHNSVCGVFLDGLNGFWWSLGFCAILFIPVIIFSIITSTFYLRKRSEELIDSYTDYPMKDVR